jgi:hypothetical protein
MEESHISEENRATRLPAAIAELYVLRKDKLEGIDQESSRQARWRAAGEREVIRLSIDARRRLVR